MTDLDNIIDLLIDNIKKLFFPEEWIELDMKFSKFELFTLLLLDKRKEITMTELVEYINSPMSTATGIVDRLVRNGCVERARSETDRRMVMLRLTDAGSQLMKKLKNMISEYISIALEDLTEEEKQFMTGIVLKIIKKLQTKMNTAAPADPNKNEIKKIEIE